MSKVANPTVTRNKNRTLSNKTEIKQEEFPEFSAFGKFEFQNKIIYIGNYKQLNTGVKIREGHGKLIHPTNDNSEFGEELYEGEWKADKMCGFGIYHYSNGDIYEGEFKDDLHNGYGKYFFTDGSRYEGEWKDHKMHGTGKYWDVNGISWAGEFRDGHFFSKDQARLLEEKRITKRINKLKEVPLSWHKYWEETISKSDKKTLKENMSSFFAKIENMSMFVNTTYPKFEDKSVEKWSEAFRFVFNNKFNVNVPKISADLLFLDKSSLLTAQLQEELSSGQIIETFTQVDLRTVRMAIGYNKELGRWLIVHFSEIIEKKK